MKMEPGDTEEVTQGVVASVEEYAAPHLELQVVLRSSAEYRFPFLNSEVELGSAETVELPDGSIWKARLLPDQRVEFSRGTETQILSAGQDLELDQARVWLVDTRATSVGTLEGINGDYVGRSWHLLGQQTMVGRLGRRLNHVELDHPTVSRLHATLFPDRRGQVKLLAESAASQTRVNGNPVAVGESRLLAHGDLLDFGDLTFRFSLAASSVSQGGLLRLCTLNTFTVQLGANVLAHKVKNEKSRALLARLGLAWGEPVPTERLLTDFWPDVGTTRGRKNLSYTLAQLRQGLGLEDEEFSSLILRSPSSLQLSPDRLDEHDFLEVEKLVAGGKALTSEAAVNRLLSLYRGPFLPECYDDWALSARRRLERAFQEAAMATCERALERGDFPTVESVGHHLLSLDPTHQDAAAKLMEAALGQAQPEQALAIFKALSGTLEREGLEPETEVIRLQLRASSAV